MIKPQVAAGIFLSYRPSVLFRAGMIAVACIGVSFLIWGNWLIRAYANIQKVTLGQSYNMAPIVLLPIWLSIIIGLCLAWLAWKRRDPVFGILSWAFFVPYLTFYSLIVHFAFIAIRFPRWALLVSVSIWIAYGPIVVLTLLN